MPAASLGQAGWGRGACTGAPFSRQQGCPAHHSLKREKQHDIDIFWPWSLPPLSLPPPRFLTFWLSFSLSLQPLSPLPTPLWSLCCPVVGQLSLLKTGFMAGFSTGEKLGAACQVFPSPHHSSLIPDSLAGSRHRHGRVCQLLEKGGCPGLLGWLPS